MRWLAPALLLAVPTLASSVGAPAPPGAATKAIFTDRAAEAGLLFTHRNGMTGKLYMPEMMGPGVALIDYDNDGRMDVFLVQGGPLAPDAIPDPAHGSRLFHNDSWTGPDGKRHLHFTDVTEQSGIRPAG